MKNAIIIPQVSQFSMPMINDENFLILNTKKETLLMIVINENEDEIDSFLCGHPIYLFRLIPTEHI